MTIVSSGADLQISGFQLSAGIIVLSGDTLEVLSAGIASDTINSGGLDVVSSGGLALATVISSGGREEVFDGGAAANAHVLSGGLQNIHTSAEAEFDITSWISSTFPSSRARRR